MQQERFEPAKPSPKTRNLCPLTKVISLYNIRGTSIQRTAQKLVMNIVHFFEQHGNDMALLEGTAASKASVVIGLHMIKIYQIQNNHKREDITTAGKKRPNKHCPVMSQYDSIRIDHTKQLVLSYYARNIPPLIRDVFENLKKQIAEEDAD